MILSFTVYYSLKRYNWFPTVGATGAAVVRVFREQEPLDDLASAARPTRDFLIFMGRFVKHKFSDCAKIRPRRRVNP
jgi:hypothetical protein